MNGKRMKTLVIDKKTGAVIDVLDASASFGGLNPAYAISELDDAAKVKRGDKLADIAGAVAVTDASRVKYRAE